jgi:hypothetical protein
VSLLQLRSRVFTTPQTLKKQGRQSKRIFFLLALVLIGMIAVTS